MGPQRRCTAAAQATVLRLVVTACIVFLVAPAGALGATSSGPTLRIGTKLVPPFAFAADIDAGRECVLQWAGAEQWCGFSFDLFDELFRVLVEEHALQTGASVGHAVNFPYTAANVTGFLNNDALIAAVARGDIDVGVAATTKNVEREREVDFTHTFLDSSLQVMAVRHTDIGATAVGLLDADVVTHTLPQVIMIMAMITGVFGTLAWVTELVEDDKERVFFREDWRGLLDAYGWAALRILGQDVGTPYGSWTQYVAVALDFSGMLVVAVLTAAITVNLTTDLVRNEIGGFEDLTDHSVGTVAGSTSERYLRVHGMVGMHIVTFDSVDDMLGNLTAGEVEAVLYDKPVLSFYANQRIAEGDASHTLVGEELDPQGYGFFVARHNTELREALNRGLLSLVWKERYVEMHGRYFQHRASSSQDDGDDGNGDISVEEADAQLGATWYLFLVVSAITAGTSACCLCLTFRRRKRIKQKRMSVKPLLLQHMRQQATAERDSSEGASDVGTSRRAAATGAGRGAHDSRIDGAAVKVAAAQALMLSPPPPSDFSKRFVDGRPANRHVLWRQGRARIRAFLDDIRERDKFVLDEDLPWATLKATRELQEMDMRLLVGLDEIAKGIEAVREAGLGEGGGCVSQARRCHHGVDGPGERTSDESTGNASPVCGTAEGTPASTSSDVARASGVSAEAAGNPMPPTVTATRTDPACDPRVTDEHAGPSLSEVTQVRGDGGGTHIRHPPQPANAAAHPPLIAAVSAADAPSGASAVVVPGPSDEREEPHYVAVELDMGPVPSASPRVQVGPGSHGMGVAHDNNHGSTQRYSGVPVLPVLHRPRRSPHAGSDQHSDTVTITPHVQTAALADRDVASSVGRGADGRGGTRGRERGRDRDFDGLPEGRVSSRGLRRGRSKSEAASGSDRRHHDRDGQRRAETPAGDSDGSGDAETPEDSSTEERDRPAYRHGRRRGRRYRVGGDSEHHAGRDHRGQVRVRRGGYSDADRRHRRIRRRSYGAAARTTTQHSDAPPQHDKRRLRPRDRHRDHRHHPHHHNGDPGRGHGSDNYINGTLDVVQVSAAGAHGSDLDVMFEVIEAGARSLERKSRRSR